MSTTTQTAPATELVPALEHSSMLAFELTVAARRPWARPWCGSPSPAPTSSTSARAPTRWTCG
ncbi:hypothetical protein [Brachybacterium sp. Z12]|uniref:hypothetical protein n=1 Tax=Brachybacterium sp. Z12 TaxID=2759167 RepID=UPI00223C0F8D|nr:hypothetical protein [Brachybacterium sp. Z12]